jgi:hypothetical protein
LFENDQKGILLFFFIADEPMQSRRPITQGPIFRLDNSKKDVVIYGKNLVDLGRDEFIFTAKLRFELLY